MVGGKRQRGRHSLMGSHQKCWLWGRHVVLETLQARRWKPHVVWISTELGAPLRREILAVASDTGVTTEDHAPAEMTRRCGSTDHQGLIAQMPPFPYHDAAAVIDSAADCPVFAVLDGIQDPFNFGALLRAADVFGVDGVFVGRQNQSAVTAQVVRSSAGAINHVRLSEVDDLCELSAELESLGVALIAAAEGAERTSLEHDFTRPLALIIGNEGRGIHPELLAACAGSVRIPQWGRVSSLNAAMAAGILLYEIRRQRTAQAGVECGVNQNSD